MLRRTFIPITSFSKPLTLSLLPSTRLRQVSNKATANMADYDPAEPSDLATMSNRLEIEDRGGRNEARRGEGKGRSLGGRGGRRGGASGRDGGEANRQVAVSKALSKLLRHAAEDVGLTLDEEGFARLDQVMKWQRLKSLQIKFEDIKTAVTDNAKQRFSMKPNPAVNPPPDLNSEEPSDWVIRANQGHSIVIDSAALLVPITMASGNVPEIVVHGTYFGFYQPIIESGGLKKMGRNHIHFSTGLPEDKQGVISGMRSDAEILIYVDIEKSLQDGVKWWISENGVVLTEGDEDGVLPMKYWKKVVGRKQNIGMLWEDGVQLADLPASLRNKKTPQGKGPKGKREEKLRGNDKKSDRKGRTGIKELDALEGEQSLEKNEP